MLNRSHVGPDSFLCAQECVIFIQRGDIPLLTPAHQKWNHFSFERYCKGNTLNDHICGELWKHSLSDWRDPFSSLCQVSHRPPMTEGCWKLELWCSNPDRLSTCGDRNVGPAGWRIMPIILIYLGIHTVPSHHPSYGPCKSDRKRELHITYL